jgi:hypothetical protein
MAARAVRELRVLVARAREAPAVLVAADVDPMEPVVLLEKDRAQVGRRVVVEWAEVCGAAPRICPK